MKDYYDKMVVSFKYNFGDRVWVYILKNWKGFFKKFVYNYYGLYYMV